MVKSAGMGNVAVRAAAASLIVSVVGIANAGVSRVVFDVSARSASGAASASFELSAASFQANENDFAWNLSQPVRFVDAGNGNLIGELRSASVVLDGDPNIELNCVVIGGAQEATFSISSIKVYFDASAQAEAGGLSARANASITLVDLDANGASLRGDGPPGTGVVQASFNENAAQFASLVGSISTSAGGTAAGYQNFPAFGFQPVSMSVAEMNSKVAFVLSPNDRATVTTSFELRGSAFQLFDDGDLNCDASIGVGDIVGFVLALTNGDSYAASFPNCSSILADLDADNVVSLADIGAFVHRVSNN